VDAERQFLKDRLVDEQFFFQGHDVLHLSVPWIPDSLHRKREELFIAALAVHKAFIDASAQRIFHNLSILMEIFGGAPLDAAKRANLNELWSTLFLVIPVVSSTFASVERMLGELPIGSIGWLLIDEAGQSLPQAAVGAVMRAKRTVVVGDPLQIPPVTSLPVRLCSDICRFFKIDPMVWSAPEASAQTLADRASKFQASFRSEQGPRRVGVPLLVHRRCQEPMFGISNRIAYDGQMVHAPGSLNAGKVGDALGPSKWFHLDGDANSKWCPAEGEKVVELIQKVAAAGILNPDLFIITPFKDVADALRKRLLREAHLFASMHIDIRSWTKDRVGTIHTVQGREADTVFLVLGAPKASLYRARSWAADTPNILNVAVSRAKQNLYVIGSHDAWSQVGHGRELASMQHIRA
jgi:superfamily I DNA and/or RNA helicase